MKVAELIEKLQEFDGDLDVVISTDVSEYVWPVSGLMLVYTQDGETWSKEEAEEHGMPLDTVEIFGL